VRAQENTRGRTLRAEEEDALRDGGDGGRGGRGGNGKARGEKEREKRSGVSEARRGWAFRADSIALDFRSRAGKTWPYRAGQAPAKRRRSADEACVRDEKTRARRASLAGHLFFFFFFLPFLRLSPFFLPSSSPLFLSSLFPPPPSLFAPRDKLYRGTLRHA